MISPSPQPLISSSFPTKSHFFTLMNCIGRSFLPKASCFRVFNLGFVHFMFAQIHDDLYPAFLSHISVPQSYDSSICCLQNPRCTCALHNPNELFTISLVFSLLENSFAISVHYIAFSDFFDALEESLSLACMTRELIYFQCRIIFHCMNGHKVVYAFTLNYCLDGKCLPQVNMLNAWSLGICAILLF